MKARIDQEPPACASIKLDGAKRKQLAADRQAEVDLVSTGYPPASTIMGDDQIFQFHAGEPNPARQADKDQEY